MTRIVTTDDIIDTYAKIRQRGLSFVTSKLNLDASKRTRSAFNDLNIESANWWIIPSIQRRWNRLITGNEQLGYEEFVVTNYLKDRNRLSMLSLGSGICKNELEFAKSDKFEKIVCVDISDKLLEQARDKAEHQGLQNIEFLAENIYDMTLTKDAYDIVLFNASLHHFKHIDDFLAITVNRTLKTNGLLIMNEYVGKNRLQFPKHQVTAINEALQLIPETHRKRFKLSLKKNKFYGSGIIRMLVADPSECVESENIMPALHKHFKPIYEAPYGGNILMNCLKDIAHNFVNADAESETILKHLFEFEDAYLMNNQSDFMFGIYEKKAEKAVNRPITRKSA